MQYKTHGQRLKFSIVRRSFWKTSFFFSGAQSGADAFNTLPDATVSTDSYATFDDLIQLGMHT